MSVDLSLQSLQEQYRSGATSPEAVINAIYDRIEASSLQPVWITLVPRAEALSHLREPAFPFYGIPFAIKDNMDVAELPTTAGCPGYAYTPGQTCTVVKRLQNAGAILIGKTNMDQFATGLVGTRSPYGACSSVFDHEYISGGSSSGSAVAVASGLVSFALGTDTAGSGRVPAAFNNIVGLKPSRGLLSSFGVVPACRSLDCISIFALNCADAAAVFDVAKSVDSNDPFSRVWPECESPAIARARVGIPRPNQLEFFGNKEYTRLYAETVSFLAGEGNPLVEVDIEPFLKAAQLLYAGPYVAERFAAVGGFVTSHIDQVDSTVGQIIAASENWSAVQAYEALYTLRDLMQRTSPVWETIDALLLPTTPTTYKIEEVKREPLTLNSKLGYYTNFVNLLDLCGVAVPAGFTPSGLPFGVTAIGPAFSEENVLRLGSLIQGGRVQFCGNHVAALSSSSIIPAVPARSVVLGVVGAHLSGQPLNHQLTDRGATLLNTTRTAPGYKFYALTNTKPAKPGLIRVPGFAGPGIEIEIWSMPEKHFGSFVAAVPPPLSIGSCELLDGSVVKGFLCEPYAVAEMPEITGFGSWRNYVRSL